ncbi:thermostable alkaline protease [Rhypophila decipiens]
MDRSSPLVWGHFKKILADGTLLEVEEALPRLKKPPLTSMFDSLQELWEKPDRQESIDRVIAWEGANHFALICWGFQVHQWNRDRPNSRAHNEEEEAEEEEFKLKPVALAKRILHLRPLVVREVSTKGSESGMNLLHYVVMHDSEALLKIILDIFTKTSLESPNALLTKATALRESPLMMIIKLEKLTMLRTILQTLPQLDIDEPILKLAIELKRDSMLFVIASLRPGCVTVELVKHCITSGLSNTLDVIPAERGDLFFNNGLLEYAVRDGNEKMIKHLLDKCPDLAVEYEGRNPPLHALQLDDVKARTDEAKRTKIRSIVLPYIIRGVNGQSPTNGSGQVLPTDKIRALLADPETMYLPPFGFRNKRKEISLDLGGFRHSSRSIQPFLKMIDGLSGSTKPTKKKTASLLTVEFETCLRYVDIPIPPLPRSDVDSKFVSERLEATLVLNWLRGPKRVTSIYELRVRDSLYLPHTEETIHNCLKGFDVEILDWMRVDISAKPLLATCPKLKRLTLYDLIGPSYSSKYELDCREREKDLLESLARQKPPKSVKFTMKFHLRSWNSLVIRHEEAAIVKRSTAVEVTQLADYIEAYSLLQTECQDPEFLEENGANFPEVATDGEESNLSRIVNVAVIDTGVDPDSIQCEEISGASFVSSESGESPWWFSYHPHGTQMAKVITELNPRCRLLVAKFGDSVMDMTVERVIRALKWAMKSKADIISISAAFFKANDELKLAIHDAINANIVVIASTAGEGHLQEGAYPANYPEVIKIAATDYWGRETAQSLLSKADFMLPGENIVAKTTFLGSDNPTDRVSGTSVATAIASGVASLVLACHRLSLSKQTSHERWKMHATFKRELVKKTFEEMAADNAGKFVKPWLFFGGSENRTCWGEARSTLDWLSRKQFPR